jgi:transketolase
VDPNRPSWKNRDRFILSKGHGCAALYAVLAERGFISKDILKRFNCDGGVLEGHPTKDVSKGIELSTGSLGHGLSVGAGMALALRKEKKKSRVFVLLSDGETESGFVWEAAMFSGQHNLSNLIAIIDYNKIQALGNVREVIDLEPYADKWRSFGWRVKEINGHDFKELFQAFDEILTESNKPSVIIAHTVKGKGVSFMEDRLLWHYRCPDEEEYRNALKEIKGQ